MLRHERVDKTLDCWSNAECRRLAEREAPALSNRFQTYRVVRALFAPELARGVRRPRSGPLVVTASDRLR